MSAETVHIIFSPQFEPFQPYLSGPYLKALLSYYGIESSLFDANIDFYNWITCRETHTAHVNIELNSKFSYLEHNVHVAQEILKSMIKNLMEYRWAVNIIDEYLCIKSPENVNIGLTHLKIGNRYSSENLRNYLQQSNNIFQLYFEYAEDNIVGPSSVSIYLFSIVVLDQLPAAIAFAKAIKKKKPYARVVIGGPIVSRLHRQLKAIDWINETFDVISPGEAYRTLPNILGISAIYDGHISPDFEDISLDEYWSCRTVLPYLVAHGCRYGKCTFCSHHLTYDGYRQSEISNVLEDLEHFSTKYDAHYISFCDEYLTPTQLKHLSSGILERGLDIKWSTFVRPEPHFRNQDFASQLYKAGCRMLMFGFESGSQETINRMHKGTKVAYFRPILEACKKSNIAVRSDFMVGFPGEQEEEVELTYNFIRENCELLDTPFSSYSVAAFELRSGIPIQEQPTEYGLIQKNLLRGDLDDHYQYETTQGLNQKDRAIWRERLIRYFKEDMDAELIAPMNKTHQLVLKGLYDEGYFSLPVLQIDPKLFPQLYAKLARGVELTESYLDMRVTSHASGGELEISSALIPSLRLLEQGTTLHDAYCAQCVWNEDTFSRFISFLYRNDFILLDECNAIPDETQMIELQVNYG